MEGPLWLLDNVHSNPVMVTCRLAVGGNPVRDECWKPEALVKMVKGLEKQYIKEHNYAPAFVVKVAGYYAALFVLTS